MILAALISTVAVIFALLGVLLAYGLVVAAVSAIAAPFLLILAGILKVLPALQYPPLSRDLPKE